MQPEAVMSGAPRVEKLACKAGLPDWPLVRAEAVRQDVLDAANDRPTLPELVSLPEAAEILGVSPQRVRELLQTTPAFPLRCMNCVPASSGSRTRSTPLRSAGSANQAVPEVPNLLPITGIQMSKLTEAYDRYERGQAVALDALANAANKARQLGQDSTTEQLAQSELPLLLFRCAGADASNDLVRLRLADLSEVVGDVPVLG